MDEVTRRRLLELGLVAVPLGLVGCASSEPAAAPLAATPSCDDGDGPTEAQTEGPYFTPGSPKRANLVEPRMAGRRLVVSGRVLTRSCKPARGAQLDFWQADAGGEYDNSGFRLRGHQFTGADGRFRLSTVVPGLYPGRTRHIHVKVQRPHGRVLTTQLYFPGEPRNRSDGIFDSALLMHVSGGRGRFDFVL